RPLESEGQRKEQEAADGDDLRSQQALPERIELAAIRTDEKRECEQEIDRPVRDDRPRQERDRALPIEDEGCDVHPLRGHPRRKAVRPEEERAEEREPGERAAPWLSVRRRRDDRLVHCARRSASDTVKRPSSLM